MKSLFATAAAGALEVAAAVAGVLAGCAAKLPPLPEFGSDSPAPPPQATRNRLSNTSMQSFACLNLVSFCDMWKYLRTHFLHYFPIELEVYLFALVHASRDCVNNAKNDNSFKFLLINACFHPADRLINSKNELSSMHCYSLDTQATLGMQLRSH